MPGFEDRNARAARQCVPGGHRGQTPASAEAAAIIGIVERAVAEIVRRKRAADEDQRGALDPFGGDRGGNVGERAAQDALRGRACLDDDRRRTVVAVKRRQLVHDALNGMNRKMHDQRSAARREGRELLGFRHARGAAWNARQHDALRNLRHGQFALKRRCCGRESRYAGRERIGDAAAREPPKLLGERRIDGKIAGMKPGDILPGGMGGGKFRFDVVERKRRRVDNACARRDNKPAIRAARSSRHKGRPDSARSDHARVP